MVHCIICKSSKSDELKYGKLITKKNISVHYFCLLLTSNLIQNGNDDEGILGFLLNDIQKEAHRIRNQICCYCGLESAGIGCCDLKCRRIFHLICGIENGALNQFSETFRSFCNLHIPKLFRDKLPPNTICSICYDKINVKHVYTMCCKSPCCKNGWFHKYCLQKFAINSGYFFKCPLCNNKDEFRELLVQKGIFVPDQDASWELEPNAFSELLERPDKCAAAKCLCPKGRKHKNLNEYDIIFCDTCGSQGIHVLCNDSNANEFNCIDCSIILSGRSENAIISNKINNSSSKKEPEDDNDNTFVVVDDDEDITYEMNAAEMLRGFNSNHTLGTCSVNADNPLNKGKFTNLKELEEVVEKSNIFQQEEYRKINYCLSEDDEIIQLRRKKRKIFSDSDENLENKNINKIIIYQQEENRKRNYCLSEDDEIIQLRSKKPKIFSDSDENLENKKINKIIRAQSSESPILQRKNTSNRLNTIVESSDDNVPLNFLTNKNSIGNNVILKEEKEKSPSPEQIKSNLSKIVTRNQSKCISSDDSNFVVNNSNNRNRRLSLKTNGNTDSNQNSPILRRKTRNKTMKTVVESSEDNIPLTFLKNKNTNQNNIILSRKNDIEKQFNIENNISQQKLQNEENSTMNKNRRSRSRVRRLDNKSSNNELYFTHSKSRDQIAIPPSTEKPTTSKFSEQLPYSSLKLNSKRYQRDVSESSLSSGDINLKEKIKCALENNAKYKQTPINRNIRSSSSLAKKPKSHLLKLKAHDDLLSSSSTEKDYNIKSEEYKEKLQIKDNSKIDIIRKSRTRSRRSKSRDQITICHSPSNEKPSTSRFSEQLPYSPRKLSLKRYRNDFSESSLSSDDINLKEKIQCALEHNAKNKQTPINKNMPSSSAKRFKSHITEFDNNSLSSSSSNLKSHNDELSSSATGPLIFAPAINSTVISSIQTRNLRKCTLAASKLSSTYRRSSRIQAKNCTNRQSGSKSDNDSHKIESITISTETDSSASSVSNLQTQRTKSKIRLRFKSNSDSDFFVPPNNKKYCNNNDNTHLKNISTISKKNIKRNTENDGKLNMNDIRRYLIPNKYRKTLERDYYEVISITIREER